MAGLDPDSVSTGAGGLVRPGAGLRTAGPAAGMAPRVSDLNERSREIFRQIVEAYVETGEPIGSRTLAKRLGLDLSPATIRNVMADLEDAGLLQAPHTSAGRIPTDVGLRLFVNGLLQIGLLPDDERARIDSQCAATGHDVGEVFDRASSLLAGLSRCAGLVLAPKDDGELRHIEFVHLGPGRALVVLVSESGLVENRIIEVPVGLPASALQEASNYLSARMVGRSLDEARTAVIAELEAHRAQLDVLTARVVEAGLATWSGEGRGGALIVQGRHNLLEDVTALEDLERIRALFETLERRESLLKLLEATRVGEGVQIFIGAESELFSHAGCSLVIAPYTNSKERVVGAIGVLGPSRLNYARIIPMVDYTAKVIGRLIG